MIFHGHRIKNGNFAALRWLSPNGEELDGGGGVLGSFILKSAKRRLFIASSTLSGGGDLSPGRSSSS
ncbi:unnamed protein product [Spirodela intermedia]|uniref:Uncharacterized protein n=1 Tax=Spirodela intermedia TaxID=51605 RepID=A0A7I8IM70_SPIIN|nr:unnamed protein product [Spirodela intermedia]CAA6658539.1 unnamed protein product [Spirodela intermedia]